MDITVRPDEPLVDEKLRITISGLKLQQTITVKTSVTERKASLSASACFISDLQGNVHIHHHPSLAGTYTGPGPFPGVIDMFGGAGGLIEFRASLLAAKGFISHALPFYDFEDLPETLKEMDFDYMKDTVNWFSTHPLVKKEGIGVCGTSQGGEIALMLATTCPKIKAVVNINGPPFSSYFPIGPFTDFVKTDFDASDFQDDGVSTKNALFSDFRDDKILKTWQSDARILYIVGEDDQSVHPKFAEKLYNCYPEDQRHKLIIKRYHNAGHLIEPPYNPVCLASYQKNIGNFLWGGKMEDHQRAQEESWTTILNFFKSILLFQDSLKCRKSNL